MTNLRRCLRSLVYSVTALVLICSSASAQNTTIPQMMDKLRERVDKLYKWDKSLFVKEGWLQQGTSVNDLPLIYWTCGNSAENVSLILSTVHGDEVTPVYFGFRLVEWVKARPELCKNRTVVIAPLVNPDGFLRYRVGTRTNFNKVDLNRNFDTPDWAASALSLWKTKGNSQRRYYPGDKAGSEPETKFQAWLIDHFKPHKILTVHAPLNMMDYDGPQTEDALKFSKAYIDSCNQLKNVIKQATPSLNFFAYGYFPGSLGNYAGVQRGIPTLTAELPSTDADKAGFYFGELEAGTKLFLDYQIKGSPIKVSESE